jgi:Na+-translocating ferredoxin:NAD+ oxidoreductase RnfG subunit
MQSNKKNSIQKNVLIASLVLAAFSLVAALLIAFTFQGTSERIEGNKRAFILKNLEDVMPLASYDNDLIADSYFV